GCPRLYPAAHRIRREIQPAEGSFPAQRHLLEGDRSLYGQAAAAVAQPDAIAVDAQALADRADFEADLDGGRCVPVRCVAIGGEQDLAERLERDEVAGVAQAAADLVQEALVASEFRLLLGRGRSREPAVPQREGALHDESQSGRSGI